MDTLLPTYRAFWAESIISILQKGKAIHITGMGQVLGISSPAGSSNYRLTLLSPKGKLRSQKVSFRDRRGFGMRGLLHIIAPRRGGAIRECEGGGSQTCETLPFWPQCLLPRLPNFLVAQLPQESITWKRKLGVPSPMLQAQNWDWCSGSPNRVSEEKPGPNVPPLCPLPVPSATCIRKSRAGTEEAERRGEKQRQGVRGALKSSEKPSDQISLGCRVSQLLKSATQWELRQATVDIIPGQP